MTTNREEVVERICRDDCRSRLCCLDNKDTLTPCWRIAHNTAALSIAEEAVLEELMEPATEMKLAGADAINKQMRGAGAPADYDAAADCWQAMLSASPFYRRVKGKPRPNDCADPKNCGWYHLQTEPPTNLWVCSRLGCPHMPQTLSAEE